MNIMKRLIVIHIVNDCNLPPAEMSHFTASNLCLLLRTLFPDCTSKVDVDRVALIVRRPYCRGLQTGCPGLRQAYQ
ncbi:hypothetical protein LshimejAT787_1103090 [Lyophyllum shimeji]|uniref:Uncharacterized protein n=1 Tax=Lyophyllum shimeji TaxID=47721 RepID=A0A9P3UP34_LYOSH|nr:hypothetical protein LshimejAT787_1103090 [Lyophyllum shimeji]